MESNIYNAINLLWIGMSTVFFILFLVVTGGNLLIRLVNKIKIDPPGMELLKSKQSSIQISDVLVINSVVEVVTQGKGVVDKIEKVD